MINIKLNKKEVSVLKELIDTAKCHHQDLVDDGSALKYYEDALKIADQILEKIYRELKNAN